MPSIVLSEAPLWRVSFPTDAHPFARSLARSIALNGWTDPEGASLAGLAGVYGVASATDAQSATVRVNGDVIHVESGLADDVEVRLLADPWERHVLLSAEPEGEEARAAELAALLAPPLPEWESLVEPFWAVVAGLPAMPSLRLVDLEREVVVDVPGAGAVYEVHAAGATLARILSGYTLFHHELVQGQLQVKGTTNQLSVFAGASMKVALHV